MSFNISYIFATRNRLPFLKLTLERLMDEIQPGEEIVVVDGNSTDGTKGYLQNLLEVGKIHQFISEPDKNQAHAWNKAILMAKGDVIKKIMDDDVFCYKAIRKCKDFMLQNPEVDVMISNDLQSHLHDYKNIHKTSRLSQFEKWRKGIYPSFTFSDVHMLIRRSSLPFIGIFNPNYIEMDWEYSLHVSYIKANIAYFTGYNALSVAHPQSITFLRDEKTIKAQGKRGEVFYEYKGDRAEINLWSEIKIFAGKMLFRKKKAIRTTKEAPSAGEIATIFNYYYDYISELNNSGSFQIIESAQ